MKTARIPRRNRTGQNFKERVRRYPHKPIAIFIFLTKTPIAAQTMVGTVIALAKAMPRLWHHYCISKNYAKLLEHKNFSTTVINFFQKPLARFLH